MAVDEEYLYFLNILEAFAGLIDLYIFYKTWVFVWLTHHEINL